jgi:hypothetical protein
MSLYAEYLKEREGIHTIELENGFATFQFLGHGHIYLKDIYVRKEFRDGDLCNELEQAVIAIGKISGCHTIVGSICLGANNWTKSKKTLRKRNYKFLKLDKPTKMIYMSKEI